jgi:hypothetical protein
MAAASGPRRLSDALSELIALRGLARARGHAEISAVWKEVAGPKIAAETRILRVDRGVLTVGVTNSPLLGELVGFHRQALLEALQRRHPELRIADLKFRLRGNVSK